MAKRAQSEIIGLLIIVLLGSLMALFSYKMLLDKPEETISDENEFLANNMLMSILNAKPDCNEASFSDLLIKVAENRAPPGCYAKENLTTILEKTLGEWQMNYEFFVFAPGVNPLEGVPPIINISVLSHDMHMESGQSQPQPFQGQGGTIYILLCLGPCR